MECSGSLPTSGRQWLLPSAPSRHRSHPASPLATALYRVSPLLSPESHWLHVVPLIISILDLPGI